MCHSSALSWVVRRVVCWSQIQTNGEVVAVGGNISGRKWSGRVEGAAGTGAGAGAGAGVGCVVCGIAPMRAGKDTPVAHRGPLHALLRTPQGGGGGGGGGV